MPTNARSSDLTRASARRSTVLYPVLLVVVVVAVVVVLSSVSSCERERERADALRPAG